ncbi:MAG: hypothetical protein ACYCZY_05415 [Lacisediminihabitans sp.]
MNEEFIVLASAKRHGVHPQDALHAVRNSIRVWNLDDALKILAEEMTQDSEIH